VKQKRNRTEDKSLFKQDESLLFGIRLHPKFNSTDVFCEDVEEEKPEEPKRDVRYEWNLKDGDIRGEIIHKWDLSQVSLNSPTLKKWNLTYEQTHVPDFIFKVVSDLLQSLEGLVFDEYGILSGDSIKTAIASTKTEFLKLTNIIYNAIPFLKELNLDITLQEPILLPDYKLYLWNFYISLKNFYYSTKSSLFNLMQKYNSLEAFMNQYWFANAYFNQRSDKMFFELKKNIIRELLQFSITSFIDKNQHKLLMYKQENQVKTLFSELYVNFGTLQTSNMLDTNQALFDFSSLFAKVYNPSYNAAISNSKQNLITSITEDFII
jgi:hypothetical protein